MVVLFCSVIASTSLLFFIRTRAIFKSNRWIIAFFAGFWLAVLGGCLAFIIDIFQKHWQVQLPSNSTICHTSRVNPYIAATSIILLVNDTLVFIAITWRLSQNSFDTYTFRTGVRILIFGDYLPVFSKVMLHDGQAYYLLVFSNLCLMVK